MKKKKGSGISKTTYDKVADSFQKDGLLDDLDKLKGMYSNSQAENSMKQVASRISNVINEKDWNVIKSSRPWKKEDRAPSKVNLTIKSSTILLLVGGEAVLMMSEMKASDTFPIPRLGLL
ncbi:hypothetical protein IFM89_031259 [Coptis chinensis]|uniref:Uncharacterized protein n=1 Tax=Coptis chinensis TaxID=261450 RepID=A0A835J1C7_9MAGN|nr:hypothetical protein IFM89_031259 [Coptis chinensis]